MRRLAVLLSDISWANLFIATDSEHTEAVVKMNGAIYRCRRCTDFFDFRSWSRVCYDQTQE